MRTRIFISYSRKDEAFAKWLRQALEARDVEVFRDVDDTLAGEEWWRRLQELIALADNIVFVLSPRSAISKVCHDEVAYANSLNKRIFPAVIEDIDWASVPTGLASRHSVFFLDEGQRVSSLEQLQKGLLTDFDWVREHTRLLERATVWQRKGRGRYELLSGRALEDAQAWLAHKPETAEAPTALHQEYIKASHDAATQRRKFIIRGLAGGLAITSGLAGFAFWQRSVAVEERDRAVANLIWGKFDYAGSEDLSPIEIDAVWDLVGANTDVFQAFWSVVEEPNHMAKLANRGEAITRAVGFGRSARTDIALQYVIDALYTEGRLKGRVPGAKDAEDLIEGEDRRVAALAGVIAVWPYRPSAGQAATLFWPIRDALIDTQTKADDFPKLADAIILIAPLLAAGQSEEILKWIAYRCADTKLTDQNRRFTSARLVVALAPRVGTAAAASAFVSLMVKLPNPDLKDPLTVGFSPLAEALAALAARSGSDRSKPILQAILNKVDLTTDPYQLWALTRAAEVLLSPLTADEVSNAVGAIMDRIASQQNSSLLARAVNALSMYMTKPQAQAAIAAVLHAKLTSTADPESQGALTQALAALAHGLTSVEVTSAFKAAFQEAMSENPRQAIGLAGSLAALGPQLSVEQINAVKATVLDSILQRLSGDAIDDAHSIVRALADVAPFLSVEEAVAALDHIRDDLLRADAPAQLAALAGAVAAIAARVPSDLATAAANDFFLRLGLSQPDPSGISAQSQPSSIEYSKRDAVFANEEFVNAMRGLARIVDAKLAARAFTTLWVNLVSANNSSLKQNLPYQYRIAIGREMADLAPRDEPRMANALLARAALTLSGETDRTFRRDRESEVWAEIFGELLRSRSEADQVSGVVALLKYPTVIGAVKEVLLAGLRERFKDAPGERSSLADVLAWIENRFPTVDLAGLPERPTLRTGCNEWNLKSFDIPTASIVAPSSC